MVHLCCSVQFSKLFEEAIDVFRKDSLACVNNVYFKHLLDFVKRHYHADHTPSTELEGVFHQVDENLLESNLVSN